MNKTVQLFLILLVCVASLGAGYVASTFVRAPEPAPPVTPVANESIQQALPDTLSPFSMVDTLGNEQSSEQWAGKILIINFWATWCEPCREEMPLLNSMRRDLIDQDVEIIGIALDELEAVRTFGDSLGIEYPSLVPGRDEGYALLEQHNPPAFLPFTLVVDGAGRITERKAGVWSREELLAAVERAQSSP